MDKDFPPLPPAHPSAPPYPQQQLRGVKSGKFWAGRCSRGGNKAGLPRLAKRVGMALGEREQGLRPPGRKGMESRGCPEGKQKAAGKGLEPKQRQRDPRESLGTGYVKTPGDRPTGLLVRPCFTHLGKGGAPGHTGAMI